MMPRVVSVRALVAYDLEVVFDDVTQGVISLSDRLFGPVCEPLREVSVFQYSWTSLVR